MFHTGRDCAACQPLQFPTAKIRHQAVPNLQCGWSCQAIFNILVIIFNPRLERTTVGFFSPHTPVGRVRLTCEAREYQGFQCFRPFAPLRANQRNKRLFCSLNDPSTVVEPLLWDTSIKDETPLMGHLSWSQWCPLN